jgi:protein-S-isoprenylcysteine O-methyltransferase Ste14
MSETVYVWGVAALFAAAPVVFASLLFVAARYGRHGDERWGPTISARAGWIVMELPSPLAFLWFYGRGEHATDPLPLLFATLFLLHYGQRAFIFPLLMRARGRRNPVVTIALSFGFNALNGSLNGWAVGSLDREWMVWLSDPRLWSGLILFAAGMTLNLHSDAVLRRLRGPGETGYRIPRGGFYRFVSCPNYLGEIVEWVGWALATWTAAGAAFAVFTAGNLAPRAAAHHRWYRERFADYPPERRAWLPGLW